MNWTTKILFFIYLPICSVIFERLSKDGRLFEAETKKHIKRYAESGLRTIAIACRELGKDEYSIWEAEFSEAKITVAADRDALLDEIADKIERDLVLLGATAVEDKLQKGVGIKLKKSIYLVAYVGAIIVSCSDLY